MKHTPGPWMLLKGSSWHIWPDVGVQNQHNLIADVRFSPEGDANARLIAAAPDLLAALNRLLATDEDHETVEDWAAAKAAVEKAEGKP